MNQPITPSPPTYYTHPTWGKCSIFQEYNTHVSIVLHSDDPMLKDQIKSCLKADLSEIPANVIELENQIQALKEAQKTPPIIKVDLNNLSPTEIMRQVPGIGRLQLKRIKERQPQPKGYERFDQFKELNKDLFDNEQVWVALESKLDFLPVEQTGT